MKWYKKVDGYENYKGEKFTGNMNKDLEPGDQYEDENNGKKVVLTIQQKQIHGNGSLTVIASGGDV